MSITYSNQRWYMSSDKYVVNIPNSTNQLTFTLAFRELTMEETRSQFRWYLEVTSTNGYDRTTGNSGSLNINGTQVWSASGQRVTTGYLGQGTFWVNRNSSTGYTAIPVLFYYDNDDANTDVNINLDGYLRGQYYELKTACTAPTTFTTNKSIVGANGTFTLSWSGATNGKGVTISSYSIYAKIVKSSGTGNSSGWQAMKTGITGNSVTLSWSDLKWGSTVPERGDEVKFGVVAVANDTNFNSSQKEGISVKYNKLPNGPTTSTLTKVITSSASGCVLDVRCGTDTDGQSLSLYVKEFDYQQSSPSSSGATLTSSGSVNYGSKYLPSQGTTKYLYFWTYDGIEMSSQVLEVKIIRNVKPTLTVAPTIETYNYADGTYLKTFSPSFTSNKTSPTIYRYLVYKIGESSTEYTYQLPSNITNIEKMFSSIPNFVYDSTKVINFYFRFICNDGVEYSDGYEVKRAIGGVSFQIPARSECLAQYNQFENEDIDGTTGQMYRKVRLKYYNDPQHTTYTYSATYKNGNTTGTIGVTAINKTLLENDKYQIFDLELSSAVAGGSTVTFSINASGSNGLTKTLQSVSFTVVKEMTLSGFQIDRSVIYPFSDNVQNTQLKLTWPFLLNSTVNEAINDYKIDKISLKFQENYNKISGSKDLVMANLSHDGTFLKTELDLSGILKWENTTVINNTYLYGTSPARFVVVLTNKFGQTFTSNTITPILNFIETPQISITKVQYKNEMESQDAAFHDITSDINITQGMTLRFVTSSSLKTEDDMYFGIQLSKGNVNNFTNGVSIEISRDSLNFVRKTESLNEINIDYQIKEDISISENWYFKAFANIKNSDTFGYSSIEGQDTDTVDNYQYRAKQHVQPTMSFLSCEVSDIDTGKEFSIELKLDDYGVDVAVNNTVLNFYLCDWSSNDKTKISNTPILTKSGSLTTHNLTLDTETFEWDSKTLSVVAESTIEYNGYSKTRTYYTNPIVVYNVTPTISYRPHQIGINASKNDLTNDNHSAASVIIKNSSGKDRIIFVGASDRAAVIINDEINGTETNTTIKLQGFYIDGGIIS